MSDNNNENIQNTTEQPVIETAPVQTLSADEYKEFLEFKVMQQQAMKNLNNNNNQQLSQKKLSINEELALKSAREAEELAKENQALALANEIKEVDELASKYLQFDKEAWLAQGRSLQEVLLAEKRGLIEKGLSTDTIQAIAKTTDLSTIDGVLLNQLLDLAKVQFKQAEENAMVRNQLINNDKNRLKVNYNLLDPMCKPLNHEQLTESWLNARSQQAKEMGNSIRKKLVII